MNTDQLKSHYGNWWHLWAAMAACNKETTMHLALTEEIVKVCRRRSDEGDCPTVERVGPEMLEEAVIELAAQRDAAGAKALGTLATAVHKFAPDLALEIARRWKVRNEKADAALDEFLAVLRGAHAPAAPPDRSEQQT